MIYDWLRYTDFTFPQAFILFVTIPVMIWWYLQKYNRQQGLIKVSTAYAFTVTSWKNRFRHLPFIFRILAILCLIFALARPQKRNDQQRTEGEGIDIVLCMDVSGSMNTRDIKPSRMEAAKEVAIEFVRSRPVDRIGLVIFSGESFTQCPLTTDKESLIQQISELGNRSYLARGTVIGEGLATSVDRVSKGEAKSKIIILLTDGKEDPPETRLLDPLTALEIAKARKIKVYTVAVSASRSTIEEHENTTAVKPKAGVQEGDYLDEPLLRKIAEETGGQYFRSRDKEGLSNIYKQIDKMEKSKIDITSFKRYEEKFLPFVLAALGLLLLEVMLRFTVFRKFP